SKATAPAVENAASFTQRRLVPPSRMSPRASSTSAIDCGRLAGALCRQRITSALSSEVMRSPDGVIGGRGGRGRVLILPPQLPEPFAAKRNSPGEHLVEHPPQRIDVRGK